MQIERLDVHQAHHHLDGLAALLRDAVESGASVGFVRPPARAAARQYWQQVLHPLGTGTRILLAAFEDEKVVGAVQLELATMPNAQHRAEVMQLMVLRSHRRRGIGTALMAALDEAAGAAGRTLLVLDTRRGDAAERLFDRLGWTRAGIIPRYARGAGKTLDEAVLCWRELAG